MVDTVTSQIYDGARNVVLHLNSVSDGTGQAGVVILDPANLTPNPGNRLLLWRCTYDIKSGGVNIEWDGTPDRSLLALSGTSTRDFSPWGGLKNDATTPTGLVRLSTVGFVANSGYAITLEFKKAGPSAPGLGTFLANLPRSLIEEELPAAAPVNRDVPMISGTTGATVKIGERLTCTMGNWDNDPSIYMYQWQSDGQNAVMDTSNNSYLLTNNDTGHAITCVVTAVNIHGSTTASPSNAIILGGETARGRSSSRRR